MKKSPIGMGYQGVLNIVKIIIFTSHDHATVINRILFEKDRHWKTNILYSILVQLHVLKNVVKPMYRVIQPLNLS